MIRPLGQFHLRDRMGARAVPAAHLGQVPAEPHRGENGGAVVGISHDIVLS